MGKDQMMRVDSEFAKLVEELRSELEESLGKDVNYARTTRFIKRTYPKETVIKMIPRKKKKKSRPRDWMDEEFGGFLSF